MFGIKEKVLDLSKLKRAAASYKIEGNSNFTETKNDHLNQVIKDINTGYNREKQNFDSVMEEMNLLKSVLNIGYWKVVVKKDNLYDAHNILLID